MWVSDGAAGQKSRFTAKTLAQDGAGVPHRVVDVARGSGRGDPPPSTHCLRLMAGDRRSGRLRYGRRRSCLNLMLAGLCIGLLSAGCAVVFDSKALMLRFIAGWRVCAVGFAVHFYLMFKYRVWRSPESFTTVLSHPLPSTGARTFPMSQEICPTLLRSLGPEGLPLYLRYRRHPRWRSTQTAPLGLR